MKVSIIIPVYYNENNLKLLYDDIKQKYIDRIDYEYEIIFIDDYSKDNSFQVLKELRLNDSHIKIYKLSKNCGAHSAILCGLSKCTGDFAIIKAADLQEPTEILFDMIDKWKDGYKVVLAVRHKRNDGKINDIFSNLYYFIVRKFVLNNMPKGGFDVYLVDRKVINLLLQLDNSNTALTGQILWSGFNTGKVYYNRIERTIGKGRWTLRKKIKLVMDTVFSFTSLPIKMIEIVGFVSVLVSLLMAIYVFVNKITGKTTVDGFTALFIFQFFCFSVTILILGVIGEYLWRVFDSVKNKPQYIVEISDEEIH